MASILSEDQFQEHVRPLLELNVSLAWRGHGSAIFLELGRLLPDDDHNARHTSGEACVMVEWDWRVEHQSAVEFGSSSPGPQIERGIRGLQGARIERISLAAGVPELVVVFSNGRLLRSMLMMAGDPQWGLKLTSGSWIKVTQGKLRLDAEPSAVPETARAAWEPSMAAQHRWGLPQAEPVFGKCATCTAFRRIDGEGYFFEYGVCTESSSPLDGRVVNLESGCPAFAASDGVARRESEED